MADGSIRIDTKIDQTGLDKGLKDVDSKLKDGTKTTGGFSKGLIGAGVAAAGAAVALKKAVEVVKDLAEAYKVQARAETQLEQAAKNNPYLTPSSVQALKDYAGELQAISTTGDEELLPFMAQLATAGRTQDEIMQIMAVSLDIAASGSMSLESAVRNLNKSFGGFSGELGETVPEVKALTTEELKQGGAVKILADRYKGMAAEVAKNTGTAEQLKSSFGDLKEELGAPFERAMGPIRTFFKGIIDGWANALKAKREYEDSKAANEAGEGTVVTLQKQVDAEKEKLLANQNQLAAATKIASQEDATLRRMGLSRAQADATLKAAQDRVKASQDVIAKLEQEQRIMAEAEASAQKTAEATAKASEEQAKLNERNKTAAEMIEANTKARNQALEALRLQAIAEGRQVENAEILAIYQKSYVDLISQSNGLISENNQASKSILATTLTLLETEKGITSEKEAQEKADERLAELQAALKEIQAEITGSDVIRKQMAELENYYAAVVNNERLTADEKTAITTEYAEKKAILEKQITDIEKAEQQARIDSYFEAVNSFANQYASIMASITRMATEGIEARAKLDIAALEKQYAAGEISAEQYEKKLQKIEKESAEKKYKLAMWEWTSQILTAVSNTALGATKALAQGGVLGLVTAALVTLAGGAQLATIIANKPIKPSFATGGIVPGTSYTGDRVEALVNSGEMILNAAQQKRMFDSLNRGGSMGGSSVKVYNSAANDVSVKPQITEEGVTLMIRKTVAKDMADGRFNGSFKTMQSGLNGTRYTN